MKPVPVAYSPPAPLRMGDIAFARMEKVNAELVAITYGAIVSQMVNEGSDIAVLTEKLDKLGYNMGIRMVDEFLAKQTSSSSMCSSFKESVDVLAKVAVKMYLGIDCELVDLGDNSFALNFPENPLNDFVQLPHDMKQFNYSQIYCGIVRGAFEQLHMKVRCEYLRDTLRGDDCNSIRISLEGIIRPENDDE